MEHLYTMSQPEYDAMMAQNERKARDAEITHIIYKLEDAKVAFKTGIEQAEKLGNEELVDFLNGLMRETLVHLEEAKNRLQELGIEQSNTENMEGVVDLTTYKNTSREKGGQA